MKSFYELNQYPDPLFPFELYTVTRGSVTPLGRGFDDVHWHEELQFTRVKEGKIKIQINGESFILKENEAIFINSGVLHQMTDVEDDSSYISMNFPEKLLGFFPNSRMEVDYVQPYTKLLAFSQILVKDQANWEKEILENLMKIEQFYFNENQREIGWHYEIAILLTQIWLLLLRSLDGQKALEQSPKKIVQHERMRTMVRFIQQFYHEDVSLQKIAGSANISSSECSRTFKKFTNKTPYRYLIDYRIQRSLELLASKKYSISEIATRTGFNQPSHYIKEFKKRYGVTPKNYQTVFGKIE